MPSDRNVLTPRRGVAQSTQQVPGNQTTRRPLSDRVDGRQTPVGNQAVAGDCLATIEMQIDGAGFVRCCPGTIERVKDDFAAVVKGRGPNLGWVLGDLVHAQASEIV